VDAVHPADLYAATDAEGRPGLLLLADDEPPRPISLEALEITLNERADGRWALGIWLHEQGLLQLFAQLCADLVEASRDLDPHAAPAMILSRLARWRQLLETGGGPMPMSRLRGLVGELLVFERCLDHWPVADVVVGWTGPLGGPQDFVLPGLRIEAKATFPSSRSVRITSADQLDPDEPMVLCVVTLSSPADSGGIAPAELVQRVAEAVAGAGGEEVVDTFRQRLASAGYVPAREYERPMFRLDAIDYFRVADGFPRIRRRDIVGGVSTVLYDVLLGACAPFRVESLV
jgi:hypothetical protein